MVCTKLVNNFAHENASLDKGWQFFDNKRWLAQNDKMRKSRDVNMTSPRDMSAKLSIKIVRVRIDESGARWVTRSDKVWLRSKAYELSIDFCTELKKDQYFHIYFTFFLYFNSIKAYFKHVYTILWIQIA